MAKEKIRFYPYLVSRPDTLLYDKALQKFKETSNESNLRKLKRAGKDKKKISSLIHESIWDFLLKNRNELEYRISSYFTNERKVGASLIYKGFMPTSYEIREPENAGFKIEIADLICKYVEDDLEMTFYKWTESTMPQDLEQYLTAYNKGKKIASVEELYEKTTPQNDYSRNGKKKKTKKKKKIRQINMGEQSNYYEKITIIGNNSTN